VWYNPKYSQAASGNQDLQLYLVIFRVQLLCGHQCIYIGNFKRIRSASNGASMHGVRKMTGQDGVMGLRVQTVKLKSNLVRTVASGRSPQCYASHITTSCGTPLRIKTRPVTVFTTIQNKQSAGVAMSQSAENRSLGVQTNSRPDLTRV
jgi:hypothetical protein